MSENNNLENGREKPVKSEAAKAAAPKKSFSESLKKAGRSIAKWARDLKGEVRKIVWPTWKQTRNNTAVVLSVVAIFTIAVWLLDLVFENVILKGLLQLVTGF